MQPTQAHIYEISKNRLCVLKEVEEEGKNIFNNFPAITDIEWQMFNRILIEMFFLLSNLESIIHNNWKLGAVGGGDDDGGEDNKEKAEEEERERLEAIREAEERRKEKHRKMEEEREKMRQDIRDKVQL